MKPHPRIRKTIKWGGAALTVLLVVVWVVSKWWAVSWFDASWCVRLWNGGVGFNTAEMAAGFPGGLLCERVDPRVPVLRRPFCEFSNNAMFVWIPLWIPVLVTVAITALAFRLDTLARRRARMNLCVKCHYDRTGLAVDAVCPECGTLVKSADPSPSRPKASS